MQLRFAITKDLLDTMTEEEYEAIEMAQDGQTRLYRIRPLMARFMVDEQGQQLNHEAAKQQLGKIPMGEWADVTSQFVNAFRDNAVPNANGSQSSSPSVATSAAPLPDGLTP
jgi:hypothetical protein